MSWIASAQANTPHINSDDREDFCFCILNLFIFFITKRSQRKQKHFQITFNFTRQTQLIASNIHNLHSMPMEQHRMTEVSFELPFHLATARTRVPPFK